MRTPLPQRLAPRFRLWRYYHGLGALKCYPLYGPRIGDYENDIVFSQSLTYDWCDMSPIIALKDDEYLEQSTGIVDSAGVEVFEGDILRFDVKGITHGPEREEGIVGEVWYSVEDGCWAIGYWTETLQATTWSSERTYDWHYSFQDRIDRATLKVIGNVHQHSELLKP